MEEAATAIPASVLWPTAGLVARAATGGPEDRVARAVRPALAECRHRVSRVRQAPVGHQCPGGLDRREGPGQPAAPAVEAALARAALWPPMGM